MFLRPYLGLAIEPAVSNFHGFLVRGSLRNTAQGVNVSRRFLESRKGLATESSVLGEGLATESAILCEYS
jgi:hypothetical protein